MSYWTTRTSGGQEQDGSGGRSCCVGDEGFVFARSSDVGGASQGVADVSGFLFSCFEGFSVVFVEQGGRGQEC